MLDHSNYNVKNPKYSRAVCHSKVVSVSESIEFVPASAVVSRFKNMVQWASSEN